MKANRVETFKVIHKLFAYTKDIDTPEVLKLYTTNPHQQTPQQRLMARVKSISAGDQIEAEKKSNPINRKHTGRSASAILLCALLNGIS